MSPWGPEPDIGRTEIPQRNSLLPYRGVLSFRSEAREAVRSETARVRIAARRRGGVADCGARAAAGDAGDPRVLENSNDESWS